MSEEELTNLCYDSGKRILHAKHNDDDSMKVFLKIVGSPDTCEVSHTVSRVNYDNVTASNMEQIVDLWYRQKVTIADQWHVKEPSLV